MTRPTDSDVALVAAYLATGSTKAAAAALGIADSTYRHRLGRVYRRHDVSCMAQLVHRLRDALPDTPERRSS